MKHRYYDITVPFLGSVILETRRRPDTSPFYETVRWPGEREVWFGRWYAIITPHDRWTRGPVQERRPDMSLWAADDNRTPPTIH